METFLRICKTIISLKDQPNSNFAILYKYAITE